MNYYKQLATSVLMFRDQKSGAFIGTGFLIYDRKNAQVQGNAIVRLVTNRHIAVLKDMIVVTNLATPSEEATQIGKPVDQFKFMWKHHDNPRIDVSSTLFPVAKTKKLESGALVTPEFISPIEDNLLMPIATLDEGDEVAFLGFPDGHGSNLPTYRPFLRSGKVSFICRDDFFIDGHSFPGNSGSPVFLTRKYNASEPSPPKLVGIVCGHLGYQDECISRQTQKLRVIFEENMGLARAISADAIQSTFVTLPRESESSAP